jgi:hypothetical protein
MGAAEYYPNFSVDDHFIAFNRIANVMGIRDNAKTNGFRNHLYYRPESEICIVPNGIDAMPDAGEVGATSAIRLKANDPDRCGGKTSPGVLNSWAKFSPRVSSVANKTYYWLIFSSTRDTPATLRANITDQKYEPVETLYSRLYMAAFTVEAGKVKTYLAIYLWNQGENSNNLTPAWDEFQIPAARRWKNMEPLKAREQLSSDSLKMAGWVVARWSAVEEDMGSLESGVAERW